MDYDAFAPYYDRIMGDRTDDIDLIKNLIREFKPDAKKILEVACGTGQILEGLNTADNELSGIDRSETMLNIARNKLPNATFYNASLDDFDIGREFDVILCVFDSLNHLLEFDRWRAFFACAQRHMRIGGTVIFDINTLHKLETLAKIPEASAVDFEGGYAQFKVHSAENDMFEWDIKVFEEQPDHDYHMQQFKITETSFPVSDIQTILETHFLGQVEVRDPYLGTVSDQSNRVYFICK